MRSKLFALFVPTNTVGKAFARDLKGALEISAEKRSSIIPKLMPVLFPNTPDEMDHAAQTLSNESGVAKDEIESLSRVAKVLLSAMNTPEMTDSIEDWAADLVELGLIPADFSESFRQLASEVRRTLLADAFTATARSAAASGVLPTLRGFGATVELRGIFAEPLRAGVGVSQSTPEVTDLVPMISVGITLDTDSPSLYFQATPTELGLLVDALAGAISQADELQRRVHIEQSHRS